MSAEIVVTCKRGESYRINLHPISLLRFAAELIEHGTGIWCERKGHDFTAEEHDYCSRCGIFPGAGGWHPGAVWSRRPEAHR